jgi:hypothetical protein
MIRCKLINLLFNVFPFKALQGFLIKNHFEKCPDCSKLLAGIEEARPLFFHEDEAEKGANIWPGLRTKICEVEETRVKPSFWLRWRWALGAACLSGFILVGFWFVQRPVDVAMTVQTGPDENLQINFIKVAEKPAGAIVYEPKDSDMIIVWAERTP